MPGETYNTLKEKYTKQTGSSTLGTAMANTAAQVANQSSGDNQGFFGQQQEEQFGVKGAFETSKEALQGQNVSDIQQNENIQAQIIQEQVDTEKEKLPEEEKEKFNLFDFVAKYSPTALIGKGIGVFLKNVLGGQPRPEQMSDPNALSIIRSLFLDDKGNLDQDKLKEYYEDHKDIIDKGILDSGIGSLEAAEGTTGLSDFDAFKDLMMGANPAGIQGTESQRRLDPESYYNIDLYKTLERPGAMEDYPELFTKLGMKPLSSRFANTTGNLVDIANINPNMLGPDGKPLSREFQKKIFDARMELNNQGINWATGNRQGGGQGGGGGGEIPPVTPPVTPPPSGPTPPPQDPTLPPGITPPLNPNTRFPDSVIRDYTQLGLPSIYGNQQIPNYANFYQGQGGQPIGLQNYLDNLRKRFGIG